MKNIRDAWLSMNRKIDKIWEDEMQITGRNTRRSRDTLTDRASAFFRLHRWELLFVLVMGCMLFTLSWILPFNEAPDEKMRYLIPTYIYNHGTLPVGWDPEVRNELWGISYAFHPILPYIFGGYLMKLVGLLNSSEKALLMTVRFINILIGMGFYWYVLQIAKRLFQNKLFRSFFIALLALLPQLLYLFVYVNTDALAVFSGAMLIYSWLVGLEKKWDRGSCTRLAVGVAICALSYFNAYGYALFSIVLFVGSLIVFYAKKGAKYCFGVIFKRGIYITVLVFILAGWWFIRSAVLYDGDFLGMSAVDRCAEEYAQEAYKPSVMKSISEQGVPLDQMLRAEDQGMGWIETTYRSTIGLFGYMEYYLGLDIYEIHKKLIKLGILGVMLQILLFVVNRLRGLAEPLIKRLNFCLLQFSFACCIIIPVLLSIIYSYTSDFQAQGRYIMPMVVPMAYFITVGIQRFVTLFFKKWFAYLLMFPLFYAVLHVFLAAFVSVYIPTFVEPLAGWSQIRFPWFVNIGLLNQLMYLLIPG